VVVRVTEPGRPAFQLRKGEEGLSLFDPAAVQPPLSESEILDAFRSGSILVVRDVAEIEARGLQVGSVLGAEPLPSRLREAHVEIRAGARMTRAEFKQALRELE
jgi:hypothetical protein